MTNKKWAIIAGSEGYKYIQTLPEACNINPIETPFGFSSPIHHTTINNNDLFVLSRHGEKGYNLAASYVNYRANIYALKELGVTSIIAWSGPGAIDDSLEIGEILVPSDIIDETKSRDYSFFNGTGLGFIRQNPVFCPDLTVALRNAISSKTGRNRTEEVYVCTEGPRLETPAEIRKFKQFGGTLVGMTLIPEAFLAKELEMCYCPVCYITNYAEGIMHREYIPGVLFEGLLPDEEKNKVQKAVENLPGIAIEAFLNVDNESICSCNRSMERYRLRGDIGEDWHTWIPNK